MHVGEHKISSSKNNQMVKQEENTLKLCCFQLQLLEYTVNTSYGTCKRTLKSIRPTGIYHQQSVVQVYQQVSASIPFKSHKRTYKHQGRSQGGYICICICILRIKAYACTSINKINNYYVLSYSNYYTKSNKQLL